jgi:hypothetical protein
MNHLTISARPLGHTAFIRTTISLFIEFLLRRRRRRRKIYSLPRERYSGRRLQGRRFRCRRRALSLDALVELNLLKIQ